MGSNLNSPLSGRVDSGFGGSGKFKRKIIFLLNFPEPPKPESTRPLKGEFKLLPKVAPFRDWNNCLEATLA